MEAHKLGALFIGQMARIVQIVLSRFTMEDVVLFEAVAHKEVTCVIQDLLIVEVIQYAGQSAPVSIISDPATIVAKSCQVVQGLEGHLFKLVHHEVELLHRHFEITVIEVILGGPAEGAESSALSHDGMEEAQ